MRAPLHHTFDDVSGPAIAGRNTFRRYPYFSSTQTKRGCELVGQGEIPLVAGRVRNEYGGSRWHWTPAEIDKNLQSIFRLQPTRNALSLGTLSPFWKTSQPVSARMGLTR